MRFIKFFLTFRHLEVTISSLIILISAILARLHLWEAGGAGAEIRLFVNGVRVVVWDICVVTPFTSPHLDTRLTR